MGRLGTEIEITAAPGLHDRILVEAIGPLLDGGRADRSWPRYLFLREPGDKGGRLRLWFDAPPAEIGPLLRCAQGVAGNTCRIEPAEALETTGPFTGRAAAPLFTDLLCAASPLILEQLRGVVSRGVQRTASALDIMVGNLYAIDIARAFPDRYPAARTADGLPAAFAVYHSHVEGLIVMSTRPSDLRQQLADQYDRVAHTVRRRVGAILAQFAGASQVSQVASLWHDIASASLRASAAAFASGELSVAGGGGRLAENHDLSASPFHQFADSSQELRTFREKDPGLLATRLVLSGLYLSLGSLGLRLRERCFLCYAISRACAELFDLDPISVVRHLPQALGGESTGRPYRQPTSIADRPRPTNSRSATGGEAAKPDLSLHRTALPAQDPSYRDGDIAWDEVAKAWRIRSYAIARNALLDSRLDVVAGSRSKVGGTDKRPGSAMEFLSSWFSRRDATDHRAIKGHLVGALGRGSLSAYEAVFSDIARPLAAELSGTVDLVSSFLQPYWLATIARLFDIPSDQKVHLLDVASTLSAILQLPRLDQPASTSVMDCCDFLHGLLQRLLSQTPPTPMVGALRSIADDVQTGGIWQAVAVFAQILTAGLHPTVSGTAAALQKLDLDPDLAAGTAAGALPLADIVEEALRLEPPFPLLHRWVKAPFVCFRHDFNRGDHVIIDVRAANRDAAVFGDPEAVRGGRPAGCGLSFGFGPHACLGASLARLQMNVALRTLVTQERPIRLLRNGADISSTGPLTITRSLMCRRGGEEALSEGSTPAVTSTSGGDT